MDEYFNCKEASLNSVQSIKQFVTERLSAAAEEIVRVFEKTLVDYEKEIKRQRSLLAVVWKPQIKLHRAELPDHFSRVKEVDCGQQLCNSKKNSTLDQKLFKPERIKAENVEFCTDQDKETFVPKQETDTFLLTLTCDKDADQTPLLNPAKSQCDLEEESIHFISVKNPEEPELNTDNHFLPTCSDLPENQDHRRDRHGHSGLTDHTDLTVQNRQHKSNDEHYPFTLKPPPYSHTGQKYEYRCETCGKVFPFKSKLIRHLRIHTGVRPYCCSICGKRFNQKSILKVHQRIHTGERPYSCDICGKRFNQNSILNVHKRTHSVDRPYSCDVCGKGFSQRSKLESHVIWHTELQQEYFLKEEILFKQQLCSQERDYSLDLKEAKSSQIKEEQDDVFDHKGGKQAEKRHHGSSHFYNPIPLKKPYMAKKCEFKCETCGKTFQFKSRLLRHLRIHTGARPFWCQICGKRFNQKSILQVHQRIHTGERPYPCDVCGKRFTQTSILMVHKRVHTGERPYSCEICGKSFTQKSILNGHKVIHTSEKPYSCKACGKSLRSQSSLLVHMQTHADEKACSREMWEGFPT